MNGLGVGFSLSWLALALAALATSCALTKRDDISDLPFDCWQGTECRCTVQDPYGEPTPKDGIGVRACDEFFDCCLLDESRDATSLRRCICYETDASCEEEAAGSKRVVVPQCPPDAPVPPPALTCAEEGEECGREYLSEHELEGCCEGRPCLLDERTGKSVCRDGNREERALYGECTSTLEAGLDSDLSLATPTIETSQGTFTFDRVESVVSRLGYTGCVTQLDVTVAGAAEHCWLTVGARTVGPELTVERLEAELGGCAGFTGQDNSFHTFDGTPFDFTYDGLTCEASEGGKLCYTGAFTFHLDGVIRDVDYSLVFEQRALVLTGTICAKPAEGCL